MLKIHQVFQRNPEAHKHQTVVKHGLEQHQFLQDWWTPAGEVSTTNQNLQKECSNLQQQIKKLQALQLKTSQTSGKGSQTNTSDDKPKKSLTDEEFKKKFGWMKDHIWGPEAAINKVDGPAHMLANNDEYPHPPRFG